MVSGVFAGSQFQPIPRLGDQGVVRPAQPEVFSGREPGLGATLEDGEIRIRSSFLSDGLDSPPESKRAENDTVPLQMDEPTFRTPDPSPGLSKIRSSAGISAMKTGASRIADQMLAGYESQPVLRGLELDLYA